MDNAYRVSLYGTCDILVSYEAYAAYLSIKEEFMRAAVYAGTRNVY